MGQRKLGFGIGCVSHKDGSPACDKMVIGVGDPAGPQKVPKERLADVLLRLINGVSRNCIMGLREVIAVDGAIAEVSRSAVEAAKREGVVEWTTLEQSNAVGRRKLVEMLGAGDAAAPCGHSECAAAADGEHLSHIQNPECGGPEVRGPNDTFDMVPVGAMQNGETRAVWVACDKGRQFRLIAVEPARVDLEELLETARRLKAGHFVLVTKTPSIDGNALRFSPALRETQNVVEGIRDVQDVVFGDHFVTDGRVGLSLRTGVKVPVSVVGSIQ